MGGPRSGGGGGALPYQDLYICIPELFHDVTISLLPYLQCKLILDHSNLALDIKNNMSKDLLFEIKTRNSFPRYAPGVTTQGDSAIKVSGSRTPNVLSGAVQLIKLLPKATTWSHC